MSQRYNVYFAGELAAGASAADVRDNLARLFKADEATLDKLFSGKVQLLKRDCDEGTAVKYRDAMARAGAVAILRAMPAAEPQPPEAPEQQPTGEPSAAERIAALANAEDDLRYRADTKPQPAAPPRDYGMELDPPGADLLRADERPHHDESSVEPPALTVDDSGQRLSAEPPPAPAPPDTSHMDAAPAGEDIPNLPRHEQPLDPDTSGIDLSPANTDLTDCAPPPAEAPELDLSDMALAETGSDVLEEQYRRRDDVTPPSTDHLSIEK